MGPKDFSNGEIRADFNSDGVEDLVSLAMNEKREIALFVGLSGAKAEILFFREGHGAGRVSLEYHPQSRVLALETSSGASSSSETLRAKFRFQEGYFYLIGLTRIEDTYGGICAQNESCGSDEYDINFLTGEVKERISGREYRSRKEKAPLTRLRDFRFEAYQS